MWLRVLGVIVRCGFCMIVVMVMDRAIGMVMMVVVRCDRIPDDADGSSALVVDVVMMVMTMTN